MWHSYDMAIGIQRQAANKHFPPHFPHCFLSTVHLELKRITTYSSIHNTSCESGPKIRDALTC